MSAQLEYQGIKETIGTLALRIRDRFPSSGLYEVCTQLKDLGDETEQVTEFHGVEATQAANELKNLCTGLSRKIWQKIMIIRTLNPLEEQANNQVVS